MIFDELSGSTQMSFAYSLLSSVLIKPEYCVLFLSSLMAQGVTYVAMVKSTGLASIGTLPSSGICINLRLNKSDVTDSSMPMPGNLSSRAVSHPSR